jgi:hypothetical protein
MHAPQPSTTRSIPSTAYTQLPGLLSDALDDRARTRFVRSSLLVASIAALLVTTGCGSSSSSASLHNPPPSTTVAVTPAAATVYRGEKQQFMAQVSGPSDKTVTWSVDARFGNIDSTGLYTAPTDIDGGDIFVTATSNAATGESATATVTLPRVTFSIAPNAIAVVPGASQMFSSTVVGLANSQVSWTVRGTGGGTISSTGLYTAPSTTGVHSVVATASVNSNYSATAAVVVTTTPATFTPTGHLHDGRQFHSATLLADGNVLVAGGGTYEAYCTAGIDSAELYSPGLGSFAPTGAMTNRRYGQTSTLLQSGDVLITGGFTYDAAICGDLDPSPAVATAELYHTSGGSFAATGSMAEAREGHTATLLPSGKILIAGGGTLGGDYIPFAGAGSATAEIYDPGTAAFTSTGSMSTARMGQTAILLANGKVLIAGGVTSEDTTPVATAELYDPLSGAFTATRNMTVGRAAHTATLLQNGTVLITGGFTDTTLAGADTAEIYDPATGSFLATKDSMAVTRLSHTATLLPNGKVLLVGGGTLVAEIYDPPAGSFAPSGVTESERSGHSATLLQNGNVIVIGGDIFGPSYTTAELYP